MLISNLSWRQGLVTGRENRHTLVQPAGDFYSLVQYSMVNAALYKQEIYDTFILIFLIILEL